MYTALVKTHVSNEKVATSRTDRPSIMEYSAGLGRPFLVECSSNASQTIISKTSQIEARLIERELFTELASGFFNRGETNAHFQQREEVNKSAAMKLLLRCV